VIRELDGTGEADARLMAHAAFGLMNSTPYALKAYGAKNIESTRSRQLLRAMTVAALSGESRDDSR
jgi:hypothetical protein